jgi:hypothetical protein
MTISLISYFPQVFFKSFFLTKYSLPGKFKFSDANNALKKILELKEEKNEIKT